jgi:hypothetical protein
MANERPLEWHLEHADELADRVFAHWGSVVSADPKVADKLPPEFMDRFYKAERYKKACDRVRECGLLSAKDEAEVKEARLAFARAYKAADDSAAADLSSYDRAVLNLSKAMKA